MYIYVYILYISVIHNILHTQYTYINTNYTWTSNIKTTHSYESHYNSPEQILPLPLKHTNKQLNYKQTNNQTNTQNKQTNK